MIDNSNITVISHVWIRDPDADTTILKQRDINPLSVPQVKPPIATPDDHTGGANNE